MVEYGGLQIQKIAFVFNIHTPLSLGIELYGKKEHIPILFVMTLKF